MIKFALRLYFCRYLKIAHSLKNSVYCSIGRTMPRTIRSLSFSSFTYFMLLLRIVTCNRFCMLSYIHNLYTANCAYRGRVEVPSDLDSDIAVLILSHNNIEQINSDSFLKYSNLVELYLNDNTLKNNSLHRDAFVPLKKLRILDLSLLRHHSPLNLSWPLPIVKLSISKNRNQYRINLSSLFNLEIFNAVDCGLMSFPHFNELAPIKEVDLSKNPLSSFSIKDIAPLCLLEKLDLQWTKDSTLNTYERWCDCLKMQTWLNRHGITAPSLNCTKPEEVFSTSCNISFIEEMQIFERCLERSVKMGQIIRLLLLALIPIIIVIFIWFLCT